MKKQLLITVLLLFTTVAVWGKAPKNGEVKVALLTDIHVTPGNENDGVIDDVIAEINAADYDLVIVDGDMTNLGSNAELRNIHKKLKKLRFPQLVTFGNHETTWSESACTEMVRLWGHDGRGQTVIGDYCFTAFPSGPYMQMADATIRVDVLAWVDKAMSRYDGQKRQIAVCHYPLNSTVTNRTDVSHVMHSHNVEAWICGHYHKPRIMNFDSIPGILGRSLALKQKGHPKFGYNTMIFRGDSLIVSEKELGGLAKVWRRIKLGNSAELAKIKCDDQAEPLYNHGVDAELIYKDNASINSAVEVHDGVVYFGNSAGVIKAYDTRSKSIVWERKVRDAVFSSPTYYDGKIIIGTIYDGLLALDAGTGKTVWQNKQMHEMVGSATLADGKLYIGTNGKMYCLNAANGKAVWCFDYGKGQPQARPALADGRLVFGAWDGGLYCVDSATGKKIWQWNNAKKLFYAPGHVVVRIAQGRVMLVTPDRYVRFFDLADGQQLWNKKERKVRESTGISEDGNTFYAKSMDCQLIAIPTSADAYTEKWCCEVGTGYDHNFCPITTRNGVAYMATRYGTVTAVRESDGVALGTAKIGNSTVVELLKADDGAIYASLIEGVIYHIR